MKNLAVFCVLFGLCSVFALEDEYTKEVSESCNSDNKYDCFKQRVLRFIDNKIELDTATEARDFGSVKIVKIPISNETEGFFPEARYAQSDSELVKIFKFIQRRADGFLQSYALDVPFPVDSGIQVVDDETNEVDSSLSFEGRGKKKKLLKFLVPLLVLLKMFKIKIISLITLGAVMLLKGLLIVGAFLIPTMIKNLKPCAKSEHHHTTEHEFSSPDYYGGHVAYGYGGHQAKEWSAHDRAYRAHKVA